MNWKTTITIIDLDLRHKTIQTIWWRQEKKREINGEAEWIKKQCSKQNGYNQLKQRNKTWHSQGKELLAEILKFKNDLNAPTAQKQNE